MSKELKKTHEIVKDFLSENNLGGVFAFYDLDTREAIAGGIGVNNKAEAAYMVAELLSMFGPESSKEEQNENT